MVTSTIEKQDWGRFFDLVSKSIEGQQIEIEVAGLEIGDQIEADWVPFDGISYDAKTDYIFVHTPLLDHAILHPSTVFMAAENHTVHAINITDDQTIQILQFRPPLELVQEREVGQEIRP